MQIDDGTGTGLKAGVNSKNRLITESVTKSEHEALSKDGDSYSWASGTLDASAADTILLVKNLSTGKNLHIQEVWLSTNTDTRAVIHLPTSEVTVAGAVVLGTNLNAGSSKVAEASAATQETGNTQGDIIWSGEVMAAGDPLNVPFNGSVIIPTNKSIGVDYVANASACDVVITGHYEE